MSPLKTKKLTIDMNRMVDLLDSFDGTTESEGFGMLCLALSLLYRGSLEEATRNGRRAMTIAEFTDTVGRQVRRLIDDPPEFFRETPPTPGCDCDVCAEKYARMARAH